jgi:hypothetical protein
MGAHDATLTVWSVLAVAVIEACVAAGTGGAGLLT